MTINYVGENLELGKWGHIAVLISFVFAALSAVSYYFSVEGKEEEKESWRKIGRYSFYTHAFGIALIVGILFYMLFNHHYEYLYVWKHSSNEMPLRYILSCFWEGQEGSFLLWTIWHVVLGVVLLLTAKKWEAPVMAIIAAVQVFLVSMLLGIHIPSGPYIGWMVLALGAFALFIAWNKLSKIEKLAIGGALASISVFLILKNIEGFKIGSSPFTQLMRENDKYGKEAFFLNPHYLHVLDGNGLNPLLQNYWMTIHPPMLFLGFASTLIPFAFAIAGLWTKKLNEWMTPALPWIFFGVAALGTGILMGGAWAYESLTFGGFWAWDPVENASLFPWLTFVGAAHVMIVQRKKGKSSYVTFILTILSFILVLYSTYLTRSGILGDSSVHSFADGLPGQLLIFLFFFFWLTGFLLMQNPLLKILFTVVSLLFLVIQFYVTDLKEISIGLVTAYIGLFVFSYFKYFPKEGSEEDEHHTSREFWMFIAAIVLLISCIHIIFTTSMPVFNKVFGTKKTPNTNIFDDYVRYQILFASIICIMMSFGLYLKYKATPVKKLIADLSISILITSALCLIVGIGYQLDFENDTFRLVSYWLFFFAASFAIIANVNYFIRILKGKIMLAGAPIAHLGFGMIMLGAFISTSQSNVLTENVGQIDLEHESDGKIKNNENLFLPINDTLPVGDYKVTYNNIHKEGHNIYFDVDYFNKKGEKEFTLSPFMQLNDKMGNVSEPATKHFLHKDIYTHMQTFELAQPKEVKLKNGDSLKVGKGHLILDTVMVKADQTGMLYRFEFNYQVNGKFVEKVILENEKNHIESKMAALKKTDAKVRLLRIAPEEDSLVFEVADANSGFMILKAIEFPFINILWAGCIVMVIGTVIAIIHRNKQNKSLVNVG